MPAVSHRCTGIKQVSKVESRFIEKAQAQIRKKQQLKYCNKSTFAFLFSL